VFLIFLAVIKTLLNYFFIKYLKYLNWIYKELHLEIKEQKQVEVITDVLCDVCNQSTKLEFGTLSAHWGYGSKHDEERYELQLCEKMFLLCPGDIEKRASR